MTSEFGHVDIHQVRAWAEAGHATIVDIRDPGSFGCGHVAGAVHVGDHNVHDFVAAAPRDRPLVVYCYHGIASQGAAAYFAAQGFAPVYSMVGGFEGWRVVYPAVADGP